MTQHLIGKLRVGEPTITNDIGKHTMAAIHPSHAAVRDHYAGMVDAIGPSDWYLRTGRLEFGPGVQAADLLYRPNDRMTLGRAHFEPKRPEQVGGTHYGNPATDVYAFSMANGLDPLQFNVVKYVTRFRKKNGLEDLKKAMHTLERLIAHEESRK